MKVFTLQEANTLLTEVAPKLRQIRDYYASVANYRELAHAAAVSAELGGGGMEGGANYVRVLYELGKLTTELHEMGVQLKDYTRGLIDFPTMRDGRVVLLCWQLGDGETIEWWHEVEDGFAGRQPL
jgi:hypothetical protein